MWADELKINLFFLCHCLFEYVFVWSTTVLQSHEDGIIDELDFLVRTKDIFT